MYASSVWTVLGFQWMWTGQYNQWFLSWFSPMASFWSNLCLPLLTFHFLWYNLLYENTIQYTTRRVHIARSPFVKSPNVRRWLANCHFCKGSKRHTLCGGPQFPCRSLLCVMIFNSESTKSTSGVGVYVAASHSYGAGFLPGQCPNS